MQGFGVQFAYPWAPWLFFLLIPAALATLIPYFLLNKKYRKTRNRIISMILHLCIMTLAICVLTGLTFVYEVGNPENEIVLLVDVSDTQESAKENRDRFVKDILEDSRYDGFKVGLVTFGFTQVTVSELTYDVESLYEKYVDAELPDASATDIAAALRQARSLIGHPQSAKIVLVTDGKETDETAASTIGSIVSQGTRVDLVYVPTEFAEDKVQVTDVEFPDYHIDPGDDCAISIDVYSKEPTAESLLELYDNGKQIQLETNRFNLIEGRQTITVHTAFEEDGLHQIRVKVSESGDGLQENNEYSAYFYLQFFNKVLIIEQAEGESLALKEMLEQESAGYEAEILNLKSSSELPESVDDLRAYDQIILNNIASSDLQPNGLDRLLYSYVYDYGGGLFTVGGNDEKGEAHAYDRTDMHNSLLQQMLPVQAIDYTPPVGVVVVIDISGSMASPGTDGETKLYWAKQGAISCLDALTERDYIGVMTLDSAYGTVLPLTPRTQESYIREKILEIDGTGGTVYSDSIRRAGQMLATLKGVDRRHIIIVSDGQPSSSDEEAYMQVTREIYRTNGITLSYVGIDISPGSGEEEKMQELVAAGHGRLHLVSDESKLLDEMRDDLNAPEIKEVNQEAFHPRVADERSPLLKDIPYDIITEEDGTTTNHALKVQLKGFYGVKARNDEYVVLTGEYRVPIYAQWKFGLGTVGSFMCDLNGSETSWSKEFMEDEDGERFLLNVVSALMPTEDISPPDFTVDLRADNYINQISVYPAVQLEEGETIKITLTDLATQQTLSLNELTEAPESASVFYTTLALSAANNYSRCAFVLKKSGVYCITVERYDAAGQLVGAPYQIYKSFSYSHEYAKTDVTETEHTAALQTLSERGKGEFIREEDDLYKIFENFVTALVRTFDPRWLFIGIAMALFLLDVAVRKFKFKWLHELLRERKNKDAGTSTGRNP